MQDNVTVSLIDLLKNLGTVSSLAIVHRVHTTLAAFLGKMSSILQELNKQSLNSASEINVQ